MARKRERIFAGFFAGLFIVTSSALTIGIIVQNLQNRKKPDIGAAAQHISQLTAAQKAALLQAQQQNKEKQVTKLQGTPLSNFTPVASIDSLQKVDTTPGTGTEVKAGDTVTVDYTGAVASTGIVFQSSLDSGQPVSFPLSNVIAGWTQGVPGMKVGGTRRLLIPANLAYGSNPPQSSGIPANADLVFDITLKKIGK